MITTFVLAMIGYAGLSGMMIWAYFGRVPTIARALNLSVVLLHVLMVWHGRYDWQFAQATRNGPIGFVVFHGALLLLAAAVVCADWLATMLVRVAFVIVTFGALGAVFRYDEVEIYRGPVIAAAAIGGAALGLTLWGKRHSEERSEPQSPGPA